MTKYLNVKKSRSEIIDTNKRALQLMRGIKSSVEECIKDHITIDGKSHDVYSFTYDIYAEKGENGKMEKVVHYLIDDEYEIII